MSQRKPALCWFGMPSGRLCVLVDRDPRDSTRPVVIILHGALRHSENTQVWMPVLADDYDVLLVDLPGHGRSPPDKNASVAGFTARLRELIARHLAERDIVVIGESVGGLVALGLGDGRMPQVRGVLVSDPPLSTGKLWPVFNNFLRPSAGPHSDFVKAFYFNTFGYFLTEGGGGIAREHLYYPLIEAVKVRTLVLTGDLPLFPVRPMPNNVPCLLDDVDRMIIRSIRNPNVALATVPGVGHLCLDPKFEEARRAVVSFCNDQLAPAAADARATLFGDGNGSPHERGSNTVISAPAARTCRVKDDI